MYNELIMVHTSSILVSTWSCRLFIVKVYYNDNFVCYYGPTTITIPSSREFSMINEFLNNILIDFQFSIVCHWLYDEKKILIIEQVIKIKYFLSEENRYSLQQNRSKHSWHAVGILKSSWYRLLSPSSIWSNCRFKMAHPIQMEYCVEFM